MCHEVFFMEFFQAIANMSGDSLAQHLANGISLGSLYALIAIGYTMVYGILLMINFAHGDIVMMACYFAFLGITVFHIPWYITFVGVIIATAILGVVIERTAYRTLRDAPKNSVLISAIGASFLLENLANYLFSGRPIAFPNIRTFIAEYFYRRDSDPGNMSGHSRYYNHQPCCAAAHRSIILKQVWLCVQFPKTMRSRALWASILIK